MTKPSDLVTGVDVHGPVHRHSTVIGGGAHLAMWQCSDGGPGPVKR